MQNSCVCVDASLLVKLIVPEPYTEQADALWGAWIRDGTLPVAPRLMRYELTAVLRKKAYRKLLTESEADTAFARAMMLEVNLIEPDDLHEHAWALARRFKQPTAYDSYYLALAESLGCPFWTTDERLFNVVRDELDWVHWLGDYRPTQSLAGE